MKEPEKTKATIEDVVAEFNAKEAVLDALCVRSKSLIEASLQDAGVRYHSIQFRVKSAEKLKKKFLNPEKNYKQLEDITDLAGLRIITYYEGDIDRAAEIIKREFDIDLKNSVDKRETEPDRFRSRVRRSYIDSKRTSEPLPSNLRARISGSWKPQRHRSRCKVLVTQKNCRSWWAAEQQQIMAEKAASPSENPPR